ncbi:hypothetical protein GEMRC1_001667 [Eukaryota sp. GEM-RC1]
MSFEPPLKKKKSSRLRSMLSSLPDSSLYEFSYPSLGSVLHLDWTSSGFLIIADALGHVSFWRHVVDDGLELVRHYRCHAAAISDLALSHDEAYCVSIADGDSSMCLFDVGTLELISRCNSLPYQPSRAVFLPGPVHKVLITDINSPNVHVYDTPFTSNPEPVSTFTPLASPVFALCSSPSSPLLVFCDEFSLFTVFDVDTLSPAPSSLTGWVDINTTDLVKLAYRRYVCEWITLSRDASKFAVMTSVGVFVFSFPSFSMIASFSVTLQSLAQKTAQEESLLFLSADEWTTRLNKEPSLVEHVPRPSFRVCFDYSTELVIFSTCVGIHICQLDPARLVSVLGKPEKGLRIATMALLQRGDAPVIAAAAVNSNRVYLFTNNEPAEPNPRDPKDIER